MGDVLKKVYKIILVFLIIFMCINIINLHTSLAIINPDNYKPSELTPLEVQIVNNKVGGILGAIRNFSAVVSVIVLMVIGVKYILGSVEQRANYKATMIPYVVGCVLVVAGTTIVTFIYNAVH